MLIQLIVGRYPTHRNPKDAWGIPKGPTVGIRDRTSPQLAGKRLVEAITVATVTVCWFPQPERKKYAGMMLHNISRYFLYYITCLDISYISRTIHSRVLGLGDVERTLHVAGKCSLHFQVFQWTTPRWSVIAMATCWNTGEFPEHVMKCY